MIFISDFLFFLFHRLSLCSQYEEMMVFDSNIGLNNSNCNND